MKQTDLKIGETYYLAISQGRNGRAITDQKIRVDEVGVQPTHYWEKRNTVKVTMLDSEGAVKTRGDSEEPLTKHLRSAEIASVAERDEYVRERQRKQAEGAAKLTARRELEAEISGLIEERFEIHDVYISTMWNEESQKATVHQITFSRETARELVEYLRDFTETELQFFKDEPKDDNDDNDKEN